MVGCSLQKFWIIDCFEFLLHMQLLVDELFEEVELLVVLGKELTEEVSVGELFFDRGDFGRQLHLVVEPGEDQVHRESKSELD